MAGEINHFYYKHVPLVKNPGAFKRMFLSYKKDFINAKDLHNSKRILEDFQKKTKEQLIRKKPRYKFVMAGDLSVLLVDFPLFEIDIFCAKYNAEVIKSFIPYSLAKYSKAARKSREIISNIFSNENNRTHVTNQHCIELSTLYQILRGVEENVDGIIYLKPLMCAPCDNVSYILKEKKHFGLPMVEISYDEHSGTNGIVTRLEAFMSIVEERKDNITI